MKTLDQKLAEISADVERKQYPEWYWPKLRDAIIHLGERWPLHPANNKMRKAA